MEVLHEIRGVDATVRIQQLRWRPARSISISAGRPAIGTLKQVRHVEGDDSVSRAFEWRGALQPLKWSLLIDVILMSDTIC